jgi:single-stranded DNA-binding protein
MSKQRWTHPVLNQVVLLGTLGPSNLDAGARPYRLKFTLRVPPPLWVPGRRAKGRREDDLFTVVKEGNQALEINSTIKRGGTALVVGALRADSRDDGRPPFVWVQAASVRCKDRLRWVGPAGHEVPRRLNSVQLWGSVAIEPQVRTAFGGQIWMSFVMAVDLPPWTGSKRRTDFFKVTSWGESVYEEAPRLRRGTFVLVQGALRSRIIEGRHDVQVYASNIQ